MCVESAEGGGEGKHLPNNILKMVGCAGVLVENVFFSFTNTTLSMKFHSLTPSLVHDESSVFLNFPTFFCLELNSSILVVYSLT